MRHVQIKDRNNKLLNPPSTFDTTLNSYVIEDLTIPMEISLDARDVVLENQGYRMRDVTWQISDGENNEQKI